MNHTAVKNWETKRTDETRMVERVLQEAGFPGASAYRYNSASIRVRVIDARFKSLDSAERDAMVEPCLEQLPERTQGDIMTLFTFAPSELQSPGTFREFFLNAEFEDPSPSML